jgi:hypothetical protein
MFTNHHIAARIAREHQCDLIEAAAAARASVATTDGAAEPTASGAGDGSDGRLLLRSWRARRAAAGEAAAGR